jgi:tRNA A-37 threonylcarbamoyl transferase component Bud32
MPEDEVLAVARSRLGRVLRGKYRLDRVLGVGGMATVYLATHRNNKQFAVKMLHPELSQREGIRTRFLREGYAANSVKHPGAVAVMDDDVAEDGSAFLVMELLEGTAVDEVWAQHGKRLPLGLTLSIGDALLDVLAAAHARGIVHRDLKPPNLFLTDSGVLKVLDFGIARLLDQAGGSQATVTGQMMGTPAFIAPEQALAKAREVDAQTDLWSAGATLFSLLSGQFVHEGENASQLLVAAATRPARSIAAVVPEVPAAVVRVIDKALTFDKKDRWPSASAMRDALRAACVEATGAPIAALPKREVVDSGLEDTMPPGVADAFEVAPTESADGKPRQPGPGVVTTAQPVAGSTSPKPPPRRRGFAVAAAVVLGCALAAGGWQAYRHAHAPRVLTCVLVDDSIDGPRCDLAVTAAIAARRYGRTAHVTEAGGHVQRVEWVNFAGTQADGRDLYTDDVQRATDGTVAAIVRRDHHGNILRWERWSDGGRRVDLVDVDGVSPRTISGTAITTIRREFDGRGLVARETYFGPTGRPRADSDGRYGVAFEHGRMGRPTRAQSLGADGQPAAATNGIAVEVQSDDETPYGRDRKYFDLDGHPALRDGYFRTQTTFDEAFNDVEWRLFGLHDEPVIHLRYGAHATRHKWDPVKRTNEQTLLDEHDRVRVEKGNSATNRLTRDERGRNVLSERLDADGNQVRGFDGTSAVRTKWSDADDSIEETNLDPSGSLVQSDWDYARSESVYDARGNAIEERHFDEQGRLAPWKVGSAIVRWSFDERGLRTSGASWDERDQPTTDAFGVSVARRRYDRMRNFVEWAAFGTDGRPTGDENGVSIIRDTYDDNGDHVAHATLDESGAPMMFKGELATERFTYDERGLLLSSEALDVHGERTLRENGAAAVRIVRDRNGDSVEEAMFGRHDEPVRCTDGYARKTRKYDMHRRLVETRLFDVTGSAATGTAGWSIEQTTYDDRSLVVRVDHLDPGGKPVLAKDGDASVTKAWNLRGNLVEETTLGTDGKRVATSAGYATKKSAYDDRDQLAEESLFDADGKPVRGKDGWALRRLRHDVMGNVVEEATFDENHAPIAPKGLTYASVRHLFDARRRLVETSFFDAAGAPVLAQDGFATVRYQRDAYGRATETSYFDRNGAPAASKDGEIVVRSTFDHAGRPVEVRSFDASGAPHPASDGCAAHRMKYDAHGHRTEDACLDVRDALAISTDGFAVQRTVHDGHGNDVEVSTYGADGQPCLDKEGIARRRNQYDERNLVVDTAYFDASDKPTHDKRGVHETRFAYSDTGKPLPATYLDDRGRPVSSKSFPVSPETGRVDVEFGDDVQPGRHESHDQGAGAQAR